MALRLDQYIIGIQFYRVTRVVSRHRMISHEHYRRQRTRVPSHLLLQRPHKATAPLDGCRNRITVTLSFVEQQTNDSVVLLHISNRPDVAPALLQLINLRRSVVQDRLYFPCFVKLFKLSCSISGEVVT